VVKRCARCHHDKKMHMYGGGQCVKGTADFSRWNEEYGEPARIACDCPGFVDLDALQTENAVLRQAFADDTLDAMGAFGGGGDSLIHQALSLFRQEVGQPRVRDTSLADIVQIVREQRGPIPDDDEDSESAELYPLPNPVFIVDEESLLPHAVVQPCGDHTVAILGVGTPTEVWCGLVEGHDGYHRFTIEWGDE
jgi:hypothetical protein